MLKKLLNSEIVPDQVNIGTLILRVSIGGMMLSHGFPKFQKLLSGDMSFADPIGVGMEISLVMAVMGEFIGSLMIISGLGTRIGALLGGVTMLVAGLIYHADDPFGTKEKALMYLAAYIVIFLIGPGKYSFDNKLKQG